MYSPGRGDARATALPNARDSSTSMPIDHASAWHREPYNRDARLDRGDRERIIGGKREWNSDRASFGAPYPRAFGGLHPVNGSLGPPNKRRLNGRHTGFHNEGGRYVSPGHRGEPPFGSVGPVENGLGRKFDRESFYPGSGCPVGGSGFGNGVGVDQRAKELEERHKKEPFLLLRDGRDGGSCGGIEHGVRSFPSQAVCEAEKSCWERERSKGAVGNGWESSQKLQRDLRERVGGKAEGYSRREGKLSQHDGGREWSQADKELEGRRVDGYGSSSRDGLTGDGVGGIKEAVGGCEWRRKERSSSVSASRSGSYVASSGTAKGPVGRPQALDVSGSASSPQVSPHSTASPGVQEASRDDGSQPSPPKRPRLGWGQGLAKYEKKKVVETDEVGVSASGGSVSGRERSSVSGATTEVVQTQESQAAEESPVSVVSNLSTLPPLTPSASPSQQAAEVVSKAMVECDGVEQEVVGKVCERVAAEAEAGGWISKPEGVVADDVEKRGNMRAVTECGLEESVRQGECCEALGLKESMECQASPKVRGSVEHCGGVEVGGEVGVSDAGSRWAKEDILLRVEKVEYEIEEVERELAKAEKVGSDRRAAGEWVAGVVGDEGSAGVDGVVKVEDGIDDGEAMDVDAAEVHPGRVDSRESGEAMQVACSGRNWSGGEECGNGRWGSDGAGAAGNVGERVGGGVSEGGHGGSVDDGGVLEEEKEEAERKVISWDVEVVARSLMEENKKRAEQARETFVHLLREGVGVEGTLYRCPAEAGVWKENVERHYRNQERMLEKMGERRQSLRFAEQVLAMRFRALKEAWKQEQVGMRQQQRGTKPVRRWEVEKRNGTALHCHRSSLRLRPVQAGMEKVEAVSEECMKKVMAKAVVGPVRGVLKMPSMIVGQENRLARRFESKNALVEDPVGMERERKSMNPWSWEEKRVFLEKFAVYNKNFSKIASHLELKTTADCVEFYYRNQKSEDFERIRRRQQLKKRRDYSRVGGSFLSTGLQTSSQRREANGHGRTEGANVQTVGAVVGVSHISVGTKAARSSMQQKPVERQRVSSALEPGSLPGAVEIGKGVSGKENKWCGTGGVSGSAAGRGGIFGMVLSGATVSCGLSSAVAGAVKIGRERSSVKTMVDAGLVVASCGQIEQHVSAPMVTGNGYLQIYLEKSAGKEGDAQWTDRERELFTEGVRLFGKDFERIAVHVGTTKSVGQCKAFFCKTRKRLGLDKLVEKYEDSLKVRVGAVMAESPECADVGRGEAAGVLAEDVRVSGLAVSAGPGMEVESDQDKGDESEKSVEVVLPVDVQEMEAVEAEAEVSEDDRVEFVAVEKETFAEAVEVVVAKDGNTGNNSTDLAIGYVVEEDAAVIRKDAESDMESCKCEPDTGLVKAVGMLAKISTLAADEQEAKAVPTVDVKADPESPQVATSLSTDSASFPSLPAAVSHSGGSVFSNSSTQGSQQGRERVGRVGGGETKSRREPTSWTQEEKEKFADIIRNHGKDWTRLHECLPSKSLTQIKTYFQNSKAKLGLLNAEGVNILGGRVAGSRKRKVDEAEDGSNNVACLSSGNELKGGGVSARDMDGVCQNVKAAVGGVPSMGMGSGPSGLESMLYPIFGQRVEDQIALEKFMRMYSANGLAQNIAGGVNPFVQQYGFPMFPNAGHQRASQLSLQQQLAASLAQKSGQAKGLQQQELQGSGSVQQSGQMVRNQQLLASMMQHQAAAHHQQNQTSKSVPHPLQPQFQLALQHLQQQQQQQQLQQHQHHQDQTQAQVQVQAQAQIQALEHSHSHSQSHIHQPQYSLASLLQPLVVQKPKVVVPLPPQVTRTPSPPVLQQGGLPHRHDQHQHGPSHTFLRGNVASAVSSNPGEASTQQGEIGEQWGSISHGGGSKERNFSRADLHQLSGAGQMVKPSNAEPSRPATESPQARIGDVKLFGQSLLSQPTSCAVSQNVARGSFSAAEKVSLQQSPVSTAVSSLATSMPVPAASRVKPYGKESAFRGVPFSSEGRQGGWPPLGNRGSMEMWNIMNNAHSQVGQVLKSKVEELELHNMQECRMSREAQDAESDQSTPKSTHKPQHLEQARGAQDKSGSGGFSSLAYGVGKSRACVNEHGVSSGEVSRTDPERRGESIGLDSGCSERSSMMASRSSRGQAESFAMQATGPFANGQQVPRTVIDALMAIAELHRIRSSQFNSSVGQPRLEDHQWESLVQHTTKGMAVDAVKANPSLSLNRPIATPQTHLRGNGVSQHCVRDSGLYFTQHYPNLPGQSGVVSSAWNGGTGLVHPCDVQRMLVNPALSSFLPSALSRASTATEKYLGSSEVRDSDGGRDGTC
uniref:Uncharacterized protein n=1 Tax=Physcomitrium patens TaxID=3218 RepID=A0A7I4AGK7_PHYPA